jgi:hypothetical protein
VSTTLTVTQGTHTVDDTYLDQFNNNANYGTSTTLRCGWSTSLGGIKYRTLLRFPLADLPANARVLTAKITLYCTTAAASAENAIWHALTTRGWVVGDATWEDYASRTAWTTAGGDWNAIGGPEENGTFTLPTATGDFDITLNAEEIAYAVDKDNYFNVLLKRLTESGADSTARVASGDHATTAWRPRLIITYIPIGVQLQGDVQIQGDVQLL